MAVNASFKKQQSLGDFQKVIGNIYGLPDDRLYSVWDLLTQQQRFTMRALKGIRKQDAEKLKVNLLIALSWTMAISNRLHIEVQKEVWERFPGVCSYCGKRPCKCKTVKSTKRKHIVADRKMLPKNLFETQKLFDSIYPAADRTLAEAGVHLAEETGEVSEAIHNFLGQHSAEQFSEIQDEIADYISCVFGVANSADINVASELAAMYKHGCHVCHQTPCDCSFATVSRLST